MQSTISKSVSITESDSFMSMPASAQLFYFHLSCRADQDGFLKDANKIRRMIGASDDDMDMLLVKGYLIYSDKYEKKWKVKK